MNFRYLDHTADAMIEAYGKTMEEAFSNVCIGMFNILTDITKVKTEMEFSFSVEAKRIETLLFDFIDELLFLLDTEHLLVSKVKEITIEKDDMFHLKCIVSGDHAGKYVTHGDIKAPTYNEMLIKKEQNMYILRVVVDI